MSARWRVFVWRSARCEPHIPDRQTVEWPHVTRCGTCAVFYRLGNVSWENWNFFALEILFSAVMCRSNDWNAFICFVPYSCFAFWLFFPSPPIWLGCILHHRWTCSLQMISSGFPICSALTVTGSSSALAGPSKPSCPPCAAWKCDTSIPCSCQSIEEKVD